MQPIFLPSTSPIFMQSLKQKVIKVKRNGSFISRDKHWIFLFNVFSFEGQILSSSQPCTEACANLGKRNRWGSIFCWVDFSPCQSDHQSAAQRLALPQGREWCEWGNEQGWVCFLHLNSLQNYSINSSSVKQSDADLLCNMLQDPPNFPQQYFIIGIIYCLGRQQVWPPSQKLKRNHTEFDYH